MERINNFGIANFKPFGNKVQKFNIKPITLIYGPNSIGKSSVIHSIAYFNNLYKNHTFSPSEIKSGDTINLGGFENFIHKKDMDKKINLEFSYSGVVNNHLDILRTGKYTHSQRKELLSISLMEISKIFKNQLNFIEDNDLLSEYKEPYLIEWLFECFNDFEQDSINFDELETDVFEYEEESFVMESSKAKRIISKVYNKPLGTMEEFYKNSSNSTKDLLSIKNLYSKAIKTEYKTSSGWKDSWVDNEILDSSLSFNDDVLLDTLKKSSEQEFNTFIEDLYKYIHNTYQLDDEIKVNTHIGKNKQNDICDLTTEYSIGNEWLFKSIHKDILEDLELGQDENYIFLLNPKNKFIEAIIRNIESFGNWSKEENIYDILEGSQVEIDNEKCLYSRNSFMGNNKSILLNLKSIAENDIATLSEWNYELEKYYIEYLKRSNEEINNLLNRKENDKSNTKSNIPNGVYYRIGLQESLTDLAEEYNLFNLNGVIALSVFSWIVEVNKSIGDEYNMKYIGPLRTFPDRHEFSYANRTVDSNESTYAWEILKNDRKVQENINRWLSSDKLKTSYELKIQNNVKLNEANIKKLANIFSNEEKTDYKEDDFMSLDKIEEFSFFDNRYDTPVNIREMGLGVSQVLPILVSLFSDKNHIIAVEQPELHLHPAVQSDLADEFIRSYKNNSNTSLIETHSEHLLLRLMKRMRQTSEGTLEDDSLSLTLDDISILYVDADDNLTYINELKLDSDGSLLDPWPGGFFEEGFSERFL